MGSRLYTSEAVFDASYPWQARVNLASLATDPLGPIVRAVVGIQPVGVELGQEATIREDGIVVTSYRSLKGSLRMVDHPLGNVIAIRDAFRRLADHCKLSDAERIELFDLLKKWMGKDLRAIKG